MNSRCAQLLALLIAAAYYYLTYRIFGYTCPSILLTGLPCPGCGLTRSALLLLNGDIAGSLRMNPMLAFIPPYFILRVCKKKAAAENYLIIVLIISFIVFGWRIVHSFGTEPLVYNPNNALGSFCRKLACRIIDIFLVLF